MKNLFLASIFLVFGMLASFGIKPEGFKTLQIGDRVPDFTLPGTDGKEYKLEDFSSSNVLMIYFTGTHCPTSHGVEERLQQLVSDMKGKSFQLVAVNPNNDQGMSIDEYSYSRYTESFEDSKRYAEDLKWTFPYLYDGEKQEMAKAYGCLATPHVFIVDKERKLRYKGRFDDSRYRDPETVSKHDARNAVEALINGEEVPVKETRPFGCSTKWKEKSQKVAQSNADWDAIPAVTAEIDLEGVKGLMKNGSGKLRLVNFWATYCAPCMKKLPELSALNRRFSNREFELITISQDEPGDKEKVEKVLGAHSIVLGKKQKLTLEKGRTTNNYIYTEKDYDALANEVDPEWPGPIPYTVLIDTDGTILYRTDGAVDSDKIIDIVLDKLSVYWSPKAEGGKRKRGKKKSRE